MKVLTATHRTQGDRPGDFCWTIPGELVTLGTTCDRDRLTPNRDGPCGCGRAFVGIASRKGTTTAEVRDLDMTRGDYLDVLTSSMHRDGYTDEEAQVEVEQHIKRLGVWRQKPRMRRICESDMPSNGHQLLR